MQREFSHLGRRDYRSWYWHIHGLDSKLGVVFMIQCYYSQWPSTQTHQHLFKIIVMSDIASIIIKCSFYYYPVCVQKYRLIEDDLSGQHPLYTLSVNKFSCLNRILLLSLCVATLPFPYIFSFCQGTEGLFLLIKKSN